MSTEKYIIFIQLFIIVLLWIQFQIPNSKLYSVLKQSSSEEPTTFSRSIHQEEMTNPPYRTDIYIWPYPKEYVVRGPIVKYQIVNWKDFQFLGSNNEIIKDNIARYKDIIFYDKTISSRTCEACVQGLRFVISDESEQRPHEEMDESYSLSIDSKSRFFELRSKSIWGAMRGLDTFSQVVLVKDSVYEIKETPVIINDAPRFKYRGLLLDTSRHFFSVNSILRTLDALAYNKMNVLHWHVTDAHSFPMFIPDFPKLSEAGSYRKYAVYSVNDVQKIVDYAAKRGIRIVAEFDVPAHTHSFGLHYPITAKCPPKWSDINWTPINPAINLTYEVIEGIYSISSKLFYDNYIHLGGDEVEKECWSLEESIKQFMQIRGWNRNSTGYEKLQAYFFDRIEKLYRKHKKTPVCWDELAFTQKEYKLPKDMVVEAWRDHKFMYQSLVQGYKTILAHGFYLDVQSPTNPRKYRYRWLDTWRDFYENEPFRTYTFTQEQKNNLLGGEACMWTEQVDERSLDSRVWPRTSAVAERLWSEQRINDTIAARKRLDHQSCILARRGIQAGPSDPGHCDATFKR